MKKLICLVILCASAFSHSSGQNTKRFEKLLIKTGLGDIVVQIDTRKAPVTSANFLRYADSGLFDSACFYRVVRLDNQPKDSVKIEVIQGGRYHNDNNGFPPIFHETTALTGIKHRNGTISMARSKPGTATSEFFICIGDQPELDFGGRRNPDGQGFAAFGKVVSGMDLVKKIQSAGSGSQYLEQPIVILGIERIRE
jgi:peptidyl-prolyl cis-trans isomerase A (cyclophilin A)